jgi:flagellar motor switch protein FliN
MLKEEIMSDMTEAPQVAHTARAPESSAAAANMSLLAGISLRMSVEVGSASLTFAELLELGEGQVVELDRQVNDLLDILVNGTLVARGEIVEVDGRYGIRVVDVVAAGASLAGSERR